MRLNTTNILVGYAVFAAVNYAVAKATAGTLRTGQPWLTLNDGLMKLNVLNWVLGAPTAPLPAGTAVVTTPTDVVTGSNVVAFPG